MIKEKRHPLAVDALEFFRNLNGFKIISYNLNEVNTLFIIIHILVFQKELSIHIDIIFSFQTYPCNKGHRIAAIRILLHHQQYRNLEKQSQ